ncbi:MAG: hypothetical protein AAF957_13300 [Planctomycetota bacterium]
MHEPSPEFTRFLEWQTRTTLRRGDRFADDRPASSRLPRLARIAALVLASLFAGAGAVVAAERIQESRELEVLLEQNRVRGELAARRVAAAKELEAAARRAYEMGSQSITSTFGATLRVAELEREAAHLELDRAELVGARREVDLRLSAPLVGTRDLVSEHLRVDAAYHARVLEVRETDEAFATAAYESGVVPRAELRRATRLADAVRLDVRRTEERLALRADFAVGRIEALDCERRDLVGGAEHRKRALESSAKHLRESLEEARIIESQGMGTGLVQPLEMELDLVEVESDLVELELELLR